MHLLVNGQVLAIAQLGRNFLVLETSTEHPPTQAEILVTVDGNEKRWTVRLPNGIGPGQKRVLLAKV